METERIALNQQERDRLRVLHMLRRSEDCLLEVWVFKELHVSGAPSWPASRGRVEVR
jgi:hypothetical protein